MPERAGWVPVGGPRANGGTCRSDQERTLTIRSVVGARPATNGRRGSPGMRRTTTAPRRGMSASRSRPSCAWPPTARSPARCSMRAAGPATTPCTSPRRALSVLGVDVAETALAIAREKADERGIDVTFAAADAFHLERLGRRFETVLDCGLFHTMDGDERPAYVASLASVTEPGGTLYVLCFSDGESRHGPAPHPSGRAASRVRPQRWLEGHRHRARPAADEVPRRRRPGLGRDDHPRLTWVRWTEATG